MSETGPSHRPEWIAAGVDRVIEVIRGVAVAAGAEGRGFTLGDVRRALKKANLTPTAGTKLRDLINEQYYPDYNADVKGWKPWNPLAPVPQTPIDKDKAAQAIRDLEAAADAAQLLNDPADKNLVDPRYHRPKG